MLQTEILRLAGDGLGDLDDDKMSGLDMMCKACNLKVTKKKMFLNVATKRSRA